MADAILARQERLRVKGGQPIGRVGMRTGHAPIADVVFRRLKKSDPTLTIVAESVLPGDYDQRQSALIGYLEGGPIATCTYSGSWSGNGPRCTSG